MTAQESQIVCPNCGNQVAFHHRNCPVCAADVGFPNVRQAAQEATELSRRYQDAYQAADARGANPALRAFDSALHASRAVMCRGTLDVLSLLRSDNELWTNFYKQVNVSARSAEYNQWDKGRQAVDTSLFPLYADKILFAALTLTDTGLGYYGDCHLVLKNDAICNRATVFEENSFLFFRRHGVVVGTGVPTGYRAVWADRNKAGVAKLHPKIHKETVANQYAQILLSEDGEHPDFVEVHIFGALHRRAIEKVTFRNIRSGAKRVLIESIRGELGKLGIEIEEAE